MDQIWPTFIENIDLDIAYEVPESKNKFLRINMVESLDGVFTIDGRAKKLSSDIDRKTFQIMRQHADVLLVGADTVRKENYSAPKFNDEIKQKRKSKGISPHLPLALISSTANFDFESALFQGDEKTIIFTTNEAVSNHIEHHKIAEFIGCGKDKVDLSNAVNVLIEKGYKNILCEGGPTINAQLLENNLIDELCLAISPQIVQGTTPTIFNGPVLNNPAKCKPTHMFTQDDFLFMRYRFLDN
ncbi:MAG: dihydrofolate reductase family protein [Acidimicrobiia bacterium]